jgi:hypothetical protein
VPVEGNKPITWELVKAALSGGGDWKDLMDARQVKEISYDHIYATNFSHGTDGHNARLIIARLSDIIDALSVHVRLDE